MSSPSMGPFLPCHLASIVGVIFALCQSGEKWLYLTYLWLTVGVFMTCLSSYHRKLPLLIHAWPEFWSAQRNNFQEFKFLGRRCLTPLYKCLNLGISYIHPFFFFKDHRGKWQMVCSIIPVVIQVSEKGNLLFSPAC